MGSRPERGAYGNARGKERQKKRREARLANPRVATALEEARQQRELIDAAVAAGQTEGSGRPKLVFEKPQADQVEPIRPPEYHEPGRVVVNEKNKLDIKWNVRDVYLLITQGYHPDYICKRTGYEPEIVAAIIEDILDEEEGGDGDAEEQD